MLLNGKQITQLSEQDLRALIGTEESRTIDFKEELKLKSGDEKTEFLEDVTSFANASGGFLVIGIAEKIGAAAELRGVSLGNVDDAILGMTNIIRDSIEPNLSGVTIPLLSLTGNRGDLCLSTSHCTPWRLSHDHAASRSTRLDLRR